MRNEDVESRTKAFEEELQKAAWAERIRILSAKLEKLENEVGTMRSSLSYSECVSCADDAESMGETEIASYLLALADKKRIAKQAKCAHAWSGGSFKLCTKCGASGPVRA